MSDRDLRIYQNGSWVSPSEIGSYSNAISNFSNVGNVSVYWGGNWIEVWPPQTYTPPMLTTISPDTIAAGTVSSGEDRIFFANLANNIFNDSGIGSFKCGHNTIHAIDNIYDGADYSDIIDTALIAGSNLSGSSRIVAFINLDTTVANLTVSQQPTLIADFTLGGSKLNYARYFLAGSLGTGYRLGIFAAGLNGTGYYFGNVAYSEPYAETGITWYNAWHSTVYYSTVNIGSNNVRSGCPSDQASVSLAQGLNPGDYTPTGDGGSLLVCSNGVILDGLSAIGQGHDYYTSGIYTNDIPANMGSGSVARYFKNYDGTSFTTYNNGGVYNFVEVKTGYGNLNACTSTRLSTNTTTYQYWDDFTPTLLRGTIRTGDYVVVGDNGVILLKGGTSFELPPITDNGMYISPNPTGWWTYNGYIDNNLIYHPWTETRNLNDITYYGRTGYIVGDAGAFYVNNNTGRWELVDLSALTTSNLRKVRVVQTNRTAGDNVRLVIFGDNDTVIYTNEFGSYGSSITNYYKFNDPAGNVTNWVAAERYLGRYN